MNKEAEFSHKDLKKYYVGRLHIPPEGSIPSKIKDFPKDAKDDLREKGIELKEETCVYCGQEAQPTSYYIQTFQPEKQPGESVNIGTFLIPLCQECATNSRIKEHIVKKLKKAIDKFKGRY